MSTPHPTPVNLGHLGESLMDQYGRVMAEVTALFATTGGVTAEYFALEALANSLHAAAQLTTTTTAIRLDSGVTEAKVAFRFLDTMPMAS